MARVLAIALQIVTVIEGDLFACRDKTAGYDPNVTVDEFGITIRGATVIEQARRIPLGAAIHIPLVIEVKDVGIVAGTAFDGFALGDTFALVFEEASPGRDSGSGKTAETVNGRGPECDEFRWRCHRRSLMGRFHGGNEHSKLRQSDKKC